MKATKITVDVQSKLFGNFTKEEIVNNQEELDNLKKDYRSRVSKKDFSTTIVFYNMAAGYVEQII